MVNNFPARRTSPTPPWMFDNGASHHVASNPALFHTLSIYGGPDESVLGNSKGLSILTPDTQPFLLTLIL